jgi:chromosome segregation ATPase
VSNSAAPANSDSEAVFNEILERVMSVPLGRATAELQRLADQQYEKLQELENAVTEQNEALDAARRTIGVLESRLDGLEANVLAAVTSLQQLAEAFAKRAKEVSDAADHHLKAAAADISDALRDNASQLSGLLQDQLTAEADRTRQEIAILGQKDRSPATTLRWGITGGIAIIILQLLLIVLVVVHI